VDSVIALTKPYDDDLNPLQINTLLLNSKRAVLYSGLPSSNLGISYFLYLEIGMKGLIVKGSSLTCPGEHLNTIIYNKMSCHRREIK
jgi:hypothetical protein